MRGSYSVDGRIERFSLVDGVYRSTDDAGDTLVLSDRLEAVVDGWEVRGGVVGSECLWVRGEDEHRAVAAGFTGPSPAYDVSTARLLGLEVGDTMRLTLVELTRPVGAAQTVRHGWARTEAAEPDVERYEVADLDSGERWVLHVSSRAPALLVSREGRWPAHLLTLT